MSALSFRCRLRRATGFELDAAFDAEPGVTALFGPSGAGKSTCLALIAGLLRPDEGSIGLRGRTLVDRGRSIWLPPHRRRTGLVFQDDLLFPHRSVEWNLRYGARRRGAHERCAIDFGELVGALDLADLLGRRPAQLSGGQRRRVALGRALLSEPQLLMLDEPLAGQDEPRRDRIIGYIDESLRRWEIPTLLVTHDQAVARRLAQRAVVFEAGRVVATGDAGPTLDAAAMRQGASGEAAPAREGPINLLRIERIRVEGDQAAGEVGGQPFTLPPGFTPAGDGAPAYVRLSARDVAIVREDVARISVRNHLRGVVRDVVEVAGRRVFVGVDAGQLVWAEVTPAARRELGLEKGGSVVCLMKATAATLVE